MDIEVEIDIEVRTFLLSPPYIVIDGEISAYIHEHWAGDNQARALEYLFHQGSKYENRTLRYENVIINLRKRC